MILILFLVFRRWFARKEIRRKELARLQRSRAVRDERMVLERGMGGDMGVEGYQGEAPPAYTKEMPRKPERVVVHG